MRNQRSQKYWRLIRAMAFRCFDSKSKEELFYITTLNTHDTLKHVMHSYFVYIQILSLIKNFWLTLSTLLSCSHKWITMSNMKNTAFKDDFFQRISESCFR